MITYQNKYMYELGGINWQHMEESVPFFMVIQVHALASNNLYLVTYPFADGGKEKRWLDANYINTVYSHSIDDAMTYFVTRLQYDNEWWKEPYITVLNDAVKAAQQCFNLIDEKKNV